VTAATRPPRRAAAGRFAACRALGLPFAATNAVRFAAPEGFATHRVLRAVGENGTVWSTKPRAHTAHFLKSPAEMAALRAPARGDRSDGPHRRGVRLSHRLRGLEVPEAHVPGGDAVLRPLAEKLRGAAAALPAAVRTTRSSVCATRSASSTRRASPYFLVVDEIAAKARLGPAQRSAAVRPRTAWSPTAWA
jgi:hypothetical protein